MYDDAVTESYHTIRRLPRPGFKVERLEPVGGRKYPLFSNAADLLPPIEVGMDNAVTPDQHTYFRIDDRFRSEEHTSELQSLMRISYAVFCLQKQILVYILLVVT